MNLDLDPSKVGELHDKPVGAANAGV